MFYLVGMNVVLKETIVSQKKIRVESFRVPIQVLQISGPISNLLFCHLVLLSEQRRSNLNVARVCIECDVTFCIDSRQYWR